VFALRQLPSAFLPEEDQGYFMASIQLPADATAERTLDIVKRYEEHVASRPGIASSISVLGFSFAGSGPNAAMAFTTLKDWDQRNGATAGEEVALAQQAMEHAPEGAIMVLQPPAIDELGRSTARRPRPWVWASRPSATRCPRPWARCTSTTSPTPGACSRSSCRPMRVRACRSMTCCG
jgi:multidrug efflux pump subunit AcrB